ncbi:MAG: sulfotransferase family 2 domain-containing protein [Bacteroidia bacterium]
MIVSHKHKFIFIKVRKTASSSLEIALSKICGDDDIISPGDPDEEIKRKEIGAKMAQHHKFPLSKHKWWQVLGMFFGYPRKTWYNHMPAQEIKQHIDPDIWNSYYKFCFERNPFDKVLSQYNARGAAKTYGNVMGYIKAGDVARLRGFDMYTIKKNVVVDDIFKFEEMDEAVKIISDKIGLKTPLDLKSIKAKGNRRKDRRHYSEVLTSEERDALEIIFAREIKLLDYQF